MYLFESTQESIETERLRLNNWQSNLLLVRDSEGRPVTRGKGFVYSMRQHAPLLLRSIGVPQQLCGLTVETMPDYHRGVYASVVAESIGGGLIERSYTPNAYGLAMLGVSSSGKTSLAAALLRRAIKAGFTAKFIDLEAFNKFHTTWIELSTHGDAYDDYAERADSWRAELWRMYEVYDFLVLDDVGRSKASQYVRDEIHSLLRTRTANGCYTIITGNFPVRQLPEYLAPSTAAFLTREFRVVGFGRPRKLVDDGMVRDGGE